MSRQGRRASQDADGYEACVRNQRLHLCGAPARLRTAVVLGVQDASFDNLKENGSQGGKLLMLADPEILKGGDDLEPVSRMEWSTGRIKRVVRSTLTAEAYSAGESGESVDYFRFLLAELFDDEWDVKRRDELAERRHAVIITDARSNGF